MILVFWDIQQLKCMAQGDVNPQKQCSKCLKSEMQIF